MSYIHIYTDGSCLNNGRKNAKGGCGIKLYTDIKEMKAEEFSFNWKKIINSTPTNQKTELLAIVCAFKLIEKIFNIYSQYKIINFKLVILTDSQYSINCITKWIKGWKKNNWKTAKKKPVKNQILLKIIYKLYENIKQQNGIVVFKHVRAHQIKTLENQSNRDWIGNNTADKLAREGAEKNI